MTTNADTILMHLEQFVYDYPGQTWYTLMSYCIGYYGVIDHDILSAVRCLQVAGKID